jgi:hypothetical protein
LEPENNPLQALLTDRRMVNVSNPPVGAIRRIAAVVGLAPISRHWPRQVDARTSLTIQTNPATFRILLCESARLANSAPDFESSVFSPAPLPGSTGMSLSLRFAVVLLVCCGTISVRAQDAPGDSLKLRVDRAIDVSSRRFLTIEHHSPWQILHGLLALRQDLVVNQPGGRSDQRIRAIDWVTQGASYHGKPLFRLSEHGGQAQPYTQPYEFEGHPNQFFAILTMSRLPREYRFQVAGDREKRSVSIDDLIKHAQATVNDREEITWTLWALSHYLPPDARWMNATGEPWSIERLVRIQANQEVNEAACGGTHGLFALTYARNAYRKAHSGRVRGAWLEADQKIRRHVEEAKLYQNDDGSLSASYFLGPHKSHDFSERVETSGHTLEWLVLAASEKQLRSRWLKLAVAAVADDLVQNADVSIQCGPLYHGLHGLVQYRERTWPARDNDTAGK